jgi:hypothetical protein
MTFKKDYINYVLYNVVNGSEDFRANKSIKSIVSTITSNDDVIKVTYLIGKTAGLEMLFKYLLYISDKIDKSQITIFNLKDNFDYDVQNLIKVFDKLAAYKSENVDKKIDSIEIPEDKLTEEKPVEIKSDNIIEKDNIKIDVLGDETVTEEIPEEISDGQDEEIAEDENAPSLTLIENTGSGLTEAEVFELSEINEDIESTVTEDSEKQTDADDTEPVETENENPSDDVFELEEIEDEVTEDGQLIGGEDDAGDTPAEGSQTEEDKKEEAPEVEIEVRKPVRDYGEPEEVVKEESVTNEAYYKFESKFFEEVKILEKLFSTVEKECRAGAGDKLSEKCLQSLSEIIEITSELSNLSRQLLFDLIADIFLTMNLYFTKSISAPEIITGERIRLLDSSLALVNSLIKGEDYLNYDVIVDKIELLKNEMMRPVEESRDFEEIQAGSSLKDLKSEETVEDQQAEPEEENPVKEDQYNQSIAAGENKYKKADLDSVNFKMRYLIKEFEKSFLSIGSIKGEYKRFDALDKIDELNNALRLIAKISAAVKMKDVLRLAEVSYVFLKYLKDYRMDLLDPEIQQIVKYIIFTFKMLLTDRKPEDFNVLVQYLNNPVKIFADS